MKTALVIMAAGMGSRFGGGIKQLEPVGPNGEIIMDYSIHDAIEAGFNKVVFIIRKDIRDAFHDAIGKRIEGICNELNIEFAYAYQELDDLPKGIEKPAKRSKPWGIPLGVVTAIAYSDLYGKEVRYCSDRKEEKDHGAPASGTGQAGYFFPHPISPLDIPAYSGTTRFLPLHKRFPVVRVR